MGGTRFPALQAGLLHHELAALNGWRGRIYQLTVSHHLSDDDLTGFEPSGTVNRTHVHTSHSNIVLISGLSS
jgi:hypothetical protein